MRQPLTHEYIQVRCNHCNTCKISRASKWVERLQSEKDHHKYSFMFTLTYDDDSVPCLFFSDDLEYLVYNRQDSERIPLSELVSLCKDEKGNVIQEDLDYLRDRLIHPLGLPVPYPNDISKFFKRFNKYCFSHVTGKYENFRYFVCHELGPSTFRCHVHGIMFFDDDRIAKRYTEILHSCWTFGTADGSAIFSHGGASYVAQYVNMSSHLPSFYSHPKLRQRLQFSKFPTIGSFDVLDEEVRRVYDDLPLRRIIHNSADSGYVTLPLQSGFKCRFFPKHQGYCQFSLDDRIGIYGAVEIIPSFDFKEFRSSLDKVAWLKYRGIINADELKVEKFLTYLNSSCRSDDAFEHALKRWYAISKRIVWYSRFIKTSVSWIVKRIDEFYKRLDYENLKNFYQFQSVYASRYPSSHLIYLYPEFYHSVTNGTFFYDTSPELIKGRLSTFHILSNSDIVPLKETFDYKQMVFQSFKIYKDTHKRKAANAYRDGRLQRTDPQLAGILRRYQTSNHFKKLCQNEM